MSLQLTARPDELRSEFLQLATKEQLASLLDIPTHRLIYLLYRKRQSNYFTFNIPKKAGGVRCIEAPHAGLKAVQGKLLQVLDSVYSPRPSVHGFVADRSVGTNALLHEGKGWVLNIDLKDFFPSINFGRVRGLFMASPYVLPPKVATVIAQLVCFDGKLPQGAPTSPMISNMVCTKLDSELQRFCARHRITYSRYADDLTFSGKTTFPPVSLARVSFDDRAEDLELGSFFESIITGNGFEINDRKVRLQRRGRRQEVTGLVVNERVNVPRRFVRQIRAMLHDWERNGLAAAEGRHWREFARGRNRPPFKRPAAFREVVKGKLDFLAMVRGLDDTIYEKLLARYCRLAGTEPRPLSTRNPNHLQRYHDGIWVIENNKHQGTGFFLQGVGFVTCDHVVLGQRSRAYHPRRPLHSLPLTYVKGDKNIDLAVCRIDWTGAYEFSTNRAGIPGAGTNVTVAGFPDFNPGASISIETGVVTGFRYHMAFPRITVSCQIITGMSGSPVIDWKHRVVGVAATGAPKRSAATRERMYGVIPIGLLNDL